MNERNEHHWSRHNLLKYIRTSHWILYFIHIFKCLECWFVISSFSFHFCFIFCLLFVFVFPFLFWNNFLFFSCQLLGLRVILVKSLFFRINSNATLSYQKAYNTISLLVNDILQRASNFPNTNSRMGFPGTQLLFSKNLMYKNDLECFSFSSYYSINSNELFIRCTICALAHNHVHFNILTNSYFIWNVWISWITSKKKKQKIFEILNRNIIHSYSIWQLHIYGTCSICLILQPGNMMLDAHHWIASKFSFEF